MVTTKVVARLAANSTRRSTKKRKRWNKKVRLVRAAREIHVLYSKFYTRRGLL